MNFRNDRLSTAEAKEKTLADYPLSLGYKPSRISRCSYCFLTSLRIGQTPSFRINEKPDRRYDFATKEGNSIIDFGQHLCDCTNTELLQILSVALSLLPVPITPFDRRTEAQKNRNKIPHECTCSSTGSIIRGRLGKTLTIVN